MNVFSLQKFTQFLKAIGRLFQRQNIFQHVWRHHPPKDEIRIAIDQVALFIERIEVAGWALAEGGVERVEVYVDTHYAGTAEYGRLRTDVGACYPNIPGSEQSGFMLSTRLDRIGQLHEKHQVIVKAFNRHGGYAEAFSPVPVTLQPVGLFCDRAGLYSDIFIVSGWAVAEEGIACVAIALDRR